MKNYSVDAGKNIFRRRATLVTFKRETGDGGAVKTQIFMLTSSLNGP